MKAFTTGKTFDLRFLSDNYPWASLGQATVVDVSSARGAFSPHVKSSSFMSSLTDGSVVVQTVSPVCIWPRSSLISSSSFRTWRL